MAADLRALFDDLVRLEVELWDAIEARLQQRLDVGLGTVQTLGVIARVDDCRVGDVVRELSITVGGASKAIDRIEAAGYCARRAHPGDRRSSVIALTPAGRRLLAKADRIVDAELEAHVGAVLPDRDIDRLAATVAKLRAARAP